MTYPHVFSPTDGPNGYDDTNKTVLSFGIELEFSVASLEDGEEDAHVGDTRKVYSLLSPQKTPKSEQGRASSPVNNIAQKEMQDNIADKLTRQFAGHIQYHPEGLNTISEAFAAISTNKTNDGVKNPERKWLVTGDSSIMGPNDTRGYDFVGIELISPAFSFSDEAVRHVKNVVNFLPKNYRIALDPSCGFHLHIACQQFGFQLSHLRKLFAILWTFEKTLFLLVSEDRRYNPQCPYLVEQSPLATSIYGSESKKLEEGLDAIMKITKTEQICEYFVNYGSPMGFNSKNCIDIPGLDGQPAKTLEIRIHEGTLDPDAIANWIRVFIRLIEFADVVNEVNLEKWLRSHLMDEIEDFGPFQLLLSLRLRDEAIYYATKTVQALDDGREESPLMRPARAVLAQGVV